MALSSVRLAVVASVGSSSYLYPWQLQESPPGPHLPFCTCSAYLLAKLKLGVLPQHPQREHLHPRRRCLLKSATRLSLEDHLARSACSEPVKLEVELATLSSATLSKPHPLLKAPMFSANTSTFLLAVAEAESQSRHSAMLGEELGGTGSVLKPGFQPWERHARMLARGSARLAALPCVLLE